MIEYTVLIGGWQRAGECQYFGWTPAADDPAPTQMWYPVQHGIDCPGHRQYIPVDCLATRYPVALNRYRDNYWIKFCDEWKDAF